MSKSEGRVCLEHKENLATRGENVPEDFQRSQDGGHDVAHRVRVGHCRKRDLDGPGKTQKHVLHDGKVVVGLDRQRAGSVGAPHWLGSQIYLCCTVWVYKTIPSALQKNLNSKNLKTEVINTGIN